MATIEERGLLPTRSDPVSDKPSRPRRWRWTREQYSRLIELGILEGRRVQLIDGEIIEMAAHKPPHANAVEKLDDALRAAFGPDYRIRVQLPVELGRRSQPEPDGTVLIRHAAGIRSEHPREPILVVEVSDTSPSYDRKVKGHMYALAGVREYWIVNLKDRQLEVYREPVPDPERRGRYRYADCSIVPADGHATPLARPEGQLAVVDLLP
jgi:Uma2 family endonuclease